MLWRFVTAALFVLNAGAILHEERFLARLGLAEVDEEGARRGEFKATLANTLYAVRFLRTPLAFANAFYIVVVLISVFV